MVDNELRPRDDIAAVGSLVEPTRRALYEHIRAVGDWVSRDEAADAAGIERATAAHHLDRLAADGLLDVDFQRRTGRRGPGAGRPAKVYRRARSEFDVSLPPRDYELAGRLLADAVERSRTGGTELSVAIDDVASAEGTVLAGEIASRRSLTSANDGEEAWGALLGALEAHGFEPYRRDDGTVVLRNCPFHQLAQRHTDLICGINLAMLGVATGDLDLDARLEPEPGQCCVTLRPRTARGPVPSGR